MKHKNSAFKTVSLLLVLIITTVAILSTQSAFAVSSNDKNVISIDSSDIEKEMRLETVMSNKIHELETNNADLHPEESKINATILNTKILSDMDGNTYTLTECEPSGYMIFHDASGVFVESSLKSISPYIGLENDLFYFGPGEYYQKTDNTLKHTIINKNISNDNDELEEISIALNDLLLENKNENIINYINGEDAYSSSNGPRKARSTRQYKGMTCVDGYKFFTQLQNCGNNVNGTCGYIAAGMLLSYYQRYYGGDLVPSNYLTSTCQNGERIYSIKDSFHKKLVNVGSTLGYGNDTDSGKIKNVINKYLKSQGIKKDYVEGIIPFNNNFSITSSIDNGHPVIWFGLVANNSHDNQTFITHAFVVYGYKWSVLVPEYIAHFGWNGANEVYFSGVLGSLFAFTSNTWTYI